MPRALKIAITCGAVPLALATLIYATWRFTRWPWLETAGLYLIFAGFVSVVIGAAILVRHVWREFRVTRMFGATVCFQTILVSGLLLVNFPAAVLFTLSAISITTRYTVRVLNESGSAIESFIITAPGVQMELGPIATGQQAIRCLGFAGDGTLNFTARQGQSVVTGILDGYVTGGLSGDTTIRVLPEGKYEIQHPNG